MPRFLIDRPLYADVLGPKLLAKFWRKVRRDTESGCWLWEGKNKKDGYGHLTLRFNGKKSSAYAHRISFELANGRIKSGLVIDHLCRNHSCVNPAHLEAITNRENLMRGVGLPVQNSRKMICLRGHPFSSPSIPGQGRICGECARILKRKYRQARCSSSTPAL